MPRVCSACCFSAEGTDSGSVSCDDALRSLCPDLKSDALLSFLEEFCGESGGILQPEAQAAQASEAALGQLGIPDTVVVAGESSEASLVGSPSADVDSINELIQSDHQYHKEEPKNPVTYHPFSTSTSLLDGRQVVTTLPSSVLQDPETRPTLLSGPSVSTASMSSQRSLVTAARGRTPKLVSMPSSSASSSKLSVTMMVDPNMVYSPRPRIEEPCVVDTHVTDMDDSGFLSADMLESLDGLLSFEDLPDFSLLDQKPQPQSQKAQTVITPSSAPSCVATGSKASQRKQTASRAKLQQPAHTVFSTTDKIQGIQSATTTLVKAETQDGHLSPDSGFASDSGSDSTSYLSDSSPSPGSFNSPDMEGLSWQEDFVNVSMDLELFPDVGLCV